jgi:phage gpG-like protein
MGRKKKWRGWSELYGKHIQMMGRGGNKKLQFSGRLRQTITPESWRSNAVGILFYDNAKTKKGFPYAEAHDQGGSMNGRPPKRSFMWLSNTGMDGIVDKVNRWLSED